MRKKYSHDRQKVAKFKKINSEFAREVTRAAKLGDLEAIKSLIKDNTDKLLTIFEILPSDHVPTKFFGELAKSQGSIELKKDDLIKLEVSDEDINRDIGRGFVHESKGSAEGIG
jgi:hypothetical protein